MKFTPEQKQEVIAQLVEKWADEMDIDSLMEYYIDGQELYLEGVSDKQLAECMEENDIELENLADIAN